MRRIVVPGEVVAENVNIKIKPGSNSLLRREGRKLYSTVVGLAEVGERGIKLIPLAGKYIPKSGDNVIGVVSSIQNSLAVVELFCPYKAGIMLEEDEKLKNIINLNSIIYARIKDVIAYKKIILENIRVLKGGSIILVSPVKVPRIIGKKSSMITMLKQETRCNIIVGKNGVIWLRGNDRDVEIAIEAIREIERKSHISGLTESIKRMIKEMR